MIYQYIDFNQKGFPADYYEWHTLDELRALVQEKPIFTKESYPEYYEAIPFSVSGSNASATLISLASELGLMVNFREHNIKSNGK